MAGYIFLLDKDNPDSLRECIELGIYSTKLSSPRKNIWSIPHEATFADYVTMRSGDNIYFFIDRKIYGIGTLIDMKWQDEQGVEHHDCKFSNYPEANQPKQFDYSDIKDKLLWDWGNGSANNRWLCTYKPEPHFFRNGIDMDEVLSSNPSAFRMLRVIQNVTFIKFDDEENQAFKDIILKSNRDYLKEPHNTDDMFEEKHESAHALINSKLSINDYSLQIGPFLENSCDGEMIRHEMAIEASLLYQISSKEDNAIDIFGNWDYLSHQVVASPFKPVAYMDKMDFFGYTFIPNHQPTKASYLVGEIKKDKAIIENIEQVMKYVDWVKDEYCHNDYSMIFAYLIAYEFSKEVIEYKKQNAKRIYSIGRRPSKTKEWSEAFKLVSYKFDSSSGRLKFHVVG